jgi:thiamine biosynthesis lipoprotein
MKVKKITIYILLLMLVFPLSGCGEQKQTDTFYAMGSFVSQTVYGADDTLFDSVKSDITTADEIITHKNDNSLLSLLNKEKIAVFDTDTYDMLYKAVDFCVNSGGIFDISLLSVSDLWDFESENPSIPKEEDKKPRSQKQGTKTSNSGEQYGYPKNDVSLDLGGIGKGTPAISRYGITKKPKSAGLLPSAGASA